MSNYYAFYGEELANTGMLPGELAIYAGTTRSGLRDGPSTLNYSRNVYLYWRNEEGFQELDIQFQDNVCEASIDADHYVFLRNESKNFIQQVSGPVKPVVIANVGAEAIRVDTLLGKFLVPAGAMFRLDQNTPYQREKKKVLLTFFDEAGCENYLKSALILEGEHWKPLNICADDGLVKIKDGAFTIQTLTLGSYGHPDADVTLKDPPFESDYEVYLRSTAAWHRVRFAGVGMKDEGLTRAHHTLSLKQHEIYDFQRLRQTPSTELMHQCAVQLPGLEELDGSSGSGQGEQGAVSWSALRELFDPSPDGADTPDLK